MRRGKEKVVPPVTCVATLSVENKTERPGKRWKRYERVVRITPGQGQILELTLRVGRKKHFVCIRLLKGRWTKLPTRDACGLFYFMRSSFTPKLQSISGY